jgi:hypothetical protein
MMRYSRSVIAAAIGAFVVGAQQSVAVAGHAELDHYFSPGGGLFRQPLQVGNRRSGAAAQKRAARKRRNMRARAPK